MQRFPSRNIDGAAARSENLFGCDLVNNYAEGLNTTQTTRSPGVPVLKPGLWLSLRRD